MIFFFQKSRCPQGASLPIYTHKQSPQAPHTSSFRAFCNALIHSITLAELAKAASHSILSYKRVAQRFTQRQRCEFKQEFQQSNYDRNTYFLLLTETLKYLVLMLQMSWNFGNVLFTPCKLVLYVNKCSMKSCMNSNDFQLCQLQICLVPTNIAPTCCFEASILSWQKSMYFHWNNFTSAIELPFRTQYSWKLLVNIGEDFYQCFWDKKLLKEISRRWTSNSNSPWLLLNVNETSSHTFRNN